MKMLDRGVIEPSNSPWSSPVVLVTKKDGSIRFCVDYRVLNSLTVKDAYPIPRVDECLDALSGSKWYSSMDLNSGFWLVGLKKEDQERQPSLQALDVFNSLSCLSVLLTPPQPSSVWSKTSLVKLGRTFALYGRHHIPVPVN